MQEGGPSDIEAGLPAEGVAPREDWLLGFRELEHARRHIHHLYEIGKLLTGSEGVERTFSHLMTIASGVLPLRTALLLEGMDAAGEPQPERPHLTVWRDAEVTAPHLARAAEQAAAAYAYLVGARKVEPQGEVLAELEGTWGWILPAPPASAEPTFITLPLVSHGRVFGALQVEAGGVLDEEGLAFVDAVASQLALALDRGYALRREVHLRERAQALEQLQREVRERERHVYQEVEEAHRRQDLLVMASALLVGSLDYRASLPGIARLLVPGWADCCAIDLLQPGGGGERIALVAFEPPGSAPGPDSFLAKALISHPWVARPAGPENLPEGPGPIERGEWAGFPSNLRVLLRVRGHTLGVLSLLSARGGRYGPGEEVLFEALARLIAATVDTALLYQQAQEAVRWREELLAVVSHDLKTPLQVVRISAQLLLKGPLPAGEERRQHGRRQLEVIVHAVSRMNGLIESILDRARTQDMPIPLAPQSLEVDMLCQEVLQVLRPLALDKSQELVVEVAPGLPHVSADRERILQVLANLVGNAIKFTPRQGTITLRAWQVDGMVRISVKDSGPGISPQDVPHLFERFWRAAGALERGTGLGLNIAKSIVEAHGGSLWVETAEGAGSTFCFTLPVASH